MGGRQESALEPHVGTMGDRAFARGSRCQDPSGFQEWSTWGRHSHLTHQGSAGLGPQDEKPHLPVLEMHFLQIHTSTPPSAGGLRTNSSRGSPGLLPLKGLFLEPRY